jgi:hypothetical protein
MDEILYTNYKIGNQKGRIGAHWPRRRAPMVASITALSGLIFSSSLLLASDCGGKSSRNSTTGDKNEANNDGGIGEGDVAPSTGAEDASTVLQVFLHDGGEMDTPRVPRLEVVATGVPIQPHLAAGRVDTVLHLVAEGEAAGLERSASYRTC